MIVRSRSALGLKYLEIDKGTSNKGYPEGAVLPLKAAHPKPVEIDQVLNTFDEPTRRAIRGNLVGFGDALAGRGPDLNAALGELRPLLDRLEPVARNLAAPSTGLERFVRALSDTAAEVAPVAETQAQMFVSLDTTFGAFASVARPFIQQTISETPPTLDTLIRTSPRIRTFLGHSATLFADLRPGIARPERELADDRFGARDRRRGAARHPAAQCPARAHRPDARGVLPGPERDRRRQTLDQVLRPPDPDAQVRDPGAVGVQLRDALGPQRPGPLEHRRRDRHRAAVHRHVGGQIDPFTGVNAPNSENGPSSAPANSATTFEHHNNFLHANPYPYTASPGQPHVCAAGNEKYIPNQVEIGNPPLLADGNRGKRPMSLLRRKQTGPVKRDPTDAVPDERIFGRHYRGPSPAKIGLAVALLASLILYLTFVKQFTKHFPFTGRGYELARHVPRTPPR